MSARSTLISIARYFVERHAGYPETPEAMLDAYRDEILSEAAAKIRAAADEIAGADNPRWGGVNEAADLIDPNVQEQQR